MPGQSHEGNGEPPQRVLSSVDPSGRLDAELVTVYWRPGCPYCAMLRRRLRRVGLVATEVNIWADPEAAARVRAITGGSETVPTVVVGGAGLVNPKASAVLDALRAVAPEVFSGLRRTSAVPWRRRA